MDSKFFKISRFFLLKNIIIRDAHFLPSTRSHLIPTGLSRKIRYLFKPWGNRKFLRISGIKNQFDHLYFWKFETMINVLKIGVNFEYNFEIYLWNEIKKFLSSTRASFEKIVTPIIGRLSSELTLFWCW